MQGMRDLRWFLGSALLALALALGCSRPAGFRAGDAGNASAEKEKKLPFHQSAEGSVANEPGADAEETGQNRGVANGLPFRTAVSPSLPVGTLLTVRLVDAVSSAEVDINKAFFGVIEDPVVMDGSVLVPSGTSVRGRVEAAQSSDGTRNKGYIRLILDSITIDGKKTPLHTASLFARGDELRRSALSASPDATADVMPRVIRLEKGRRLIFRLTAPVGPVGSEIGLARDTTFPSTE